MGADYSAYAIIGVCLPNQEDLPRLKVNVRKKAFKHDFKDDGEQNFHPKNGKPLWLDEYEEVASEDSSIIYQLEDDEIEAEEGQKVLNAPKGLGFCIGTDDERIFLGVVVKTGNSNGGDEVGFSHLPDIAEVKSKLKGCLDPLGLWVEKDFGLYALLYCSY